MITCSNCPEAAVFDYYGTTYCARHLPRFLTRTEGVLKPVVQPTAAGAAVEATPVVDEPAVVEEEKKAAPRKRAPKKAPTEEPAEAE